MLMRGANDACSDNISTLKKSVAVWVNKLPFTQPALNPEDCSNCGLQHDTTGKLICPIEFNWDDLE
ncbi:hypothetical protein DXG01_007127 [Tephrocybe rancida]|nr:hypothetical protein DXG01_007127 [Tephrocybe rancida]